MNVRNCHPREEDTCPGAPRSRFSHGAVHVCVMTAGLDELTQRLDRRPAWVAAVSTSAPPMVGGEASRETDDLGPMGTATAASLREVGLEPPAPPPPPPSSDLFVSLHTGCPAGDLGQETHEAAFVGYARAPLTLVSLSQSTNRWMDVRFPECSGGACVVTHVAIGTEPIGAGRPICSWRLRDPIAVTVGITATPFLDSELLWHLRAELRLEQSAPVRQEPATPAPIERARPRPPATVEPPTALATRTKELFTGMALVVMCAGFGVAIEGFVAAQRRVATDGLEQVARMIRDSYQANRASDAVFEARIDEVRKLAQHAAEAAERTERAERRARRLAHGRRP